MMSGDYIFVDEKFDFNVFYYGRYELSNFLKMRILVCDGGKWNFIFVFWYVIVFDDVR